MDVLTAAYTATHPAPVIAAVDPDVAARPCARCAQPTSSATLACKVVSKVFTAYDGWHDCSASGVLCPICTWGYRTPQLRLVPHLVQAGMSSPASANAANPAAATAVPRLHALTARHVVDVLAEPLDPRTALVVPLRPGRKHLLPNAGWGKVTVDDAQLSWTAADAHRLHLVRRLREAGFGSRQLAEPAPPYPVLRRTPASSWTQLITDWALLTPWRTRQIWLDLACAITIPTPPTNRAAGSTRVNRPAA